MCPPRLCMPFADERGRKSWYFSRLRFAAADTSHAPRAESRSLRSRLRALPSNQDSVASLTRLRLLDRLTQEQAEAQAAVPERRVAPVTDRRPAIRGLVAPAAAPEDPARATGSTHRIRCCASCIVAIPI
jgi:hypothetical protein